MAGYLSVWRDAPATATAKTDILDIVVAISERVPWQVARRMLEVHGVSPRSGWSNTIEEVKLRESFKGLDVDGLYEAFVQHACCGEKSVRVYDLGANADTLREKLSAEAQLSRMPRPSLKDKIQKSDPTEPALICVLQKPEGLFGIFGAIREHDHQTPLKTESLPEAARAAFPGVDEIIAIRSEMFQSYAAIWMPSGSQIVEVRVDHFVNHSQQSLVDFHQQMYVKLHAMSGSKAAIAPRELFPAIKNLYDAENEGIVMELAFVTTTGSVKHERMRSHDSLRKERYHVGGKEALATEIEPFRLGVRWSREYLGSRQYNAPELHLEGTLPMASSQSPGLTKFLVRKAAGIEDYDWVRDKLFEHL
ncbi:hypothetical protein HB777_01425 [Mesorhizobium loti]|nr:hypothetical protein HB777_01425 [Mesorhizobium loti]